MKLRDLLPVLLLMVIVASSTAAYMKEGTYRGAIITVGDDRIVVAAPDQGQITFEVAQVKDGDQLVSDRAQMAQIKTLQKDQMVEVKWGQDHTGHYYIVELTSGPAGGARQGIVRGKVITASEGRIVVAKGDGGQITLESSWIRRQGKYQRDPFHDLFGQGLAAGDEVVAMWELDEGTHYVIRGIAKTDPAGQALALALMQAQLRETYQQINQLQDRIAELQTLLRQALQAPQPKPQ